MLRSLVLIFLLSVIVIKAQAQNFYVNHITPEGNNIDADIKEISIHFSEPITMGSGAIAADQKAKIRIDPPVDCEWVYSKTDTISCMLKKKLAPKKSYTVTVATGFKGLSSTSKLPYGRNERFTTKSLGILRYDTTWNKNIPTLKTTLSFPIKGTNLKGSILCGEKIISSTLKLLSPMVVEVVAKEEIQKNQSCFFQFDQNLEYSEFPGGEKLSQKMLIHSEVKSMFGHNDIDFEIGCGSSYHLRTKASSLSVPQIACEYRDAVHLFISMDISKKDKIKDYIQVIPDNGVKITADDYKISIENFKKPNQVFAIKIKKNIPLSGQALNDDIIFQLDTLVGPYLLGIRKNRGVMERISPQQMPYSVQNIQSLNLDYEFLTSEEQLHAFQDNSQIDAKKAKKYSEHYDFSPKTIANENSLLPLEIKPLAEKAKVQSGLFVGKLQAKSISSNYVEATEVLRPPYNQENDREYAFNYLITDLGLHLKKAGKATLVWAFSLNSGASLKGVQVTLSVTRAHKQKESFVRTTDSNGLASFDDLILEERDQLFIYAKYEQDISYLNTADSLWSQGISNWDFNLSSNYYGTAKGSLIADVVSERPLYLPGEEVRLKIYVRKHKPDSLELAAVGKEITVGVIDSRSAEVTKVKVHLNEYGTASLSYQLPTNAPTGPYALKIFEGGVETYLDSAFSVEEFRKPEFKVVLSESAEKYHGVLSYFKGGGVPNVTGEAVVYFQKLSFKPRDPMLQDFRFPKSMAASYDDYYYDNTYSETGSLNVLNRTSLTTDNEGKFDLIKNDLKLELKEYGRLLVEGNFQDSNGGTIAGRVEGRVSPLKIFPGIKFDEWYYNTGKKINPKVIVLNDSGKIHKGIKLKMTINRIDWIYERRLGSGNYFYYDSRKEVKEITHCDFISADNFSSCDIKLKDNGYYEFTIALADGSSDSTTAGIYVYEEGGYMGFAANNHDRINLNIENKELKLGDTLKVMAISPLKDAEALITLERDGILYKEKVKVEGNVLLWEKKINQEEFIPGFFVSVVIIKGRTSDKIEGEVDLGKPSFKIGYGRVEVENSAKRLKADIKLAQKLVAPGKETEADFTLKDYQGKPVKGELAIAVVDDALLSLTNNYSKNYDVLDTFYSLGDLGVFNYQTLTQLLGRRTYGKKGANPGGGGGFELRSKFQNTALWLPQAETDDNGHLHVKFKVPDNLTTWKVIAIAVDKNHRFGFSEDEFLVSKPLMTEPAFPNFLVAGDKFNAKVLLTNRTGEKQNLKVEGKSELLSFKETKKELSLENNAQGNLSFQVESKNSGIADIIVTAKAGQNTDGFKINLPVLFNGLDNVHVDHGIMNTNSKEFPLVIAPNAYPQSLLLSVNYSNTVLNGLDEIFRYVLGYPYGCWEQRLTKAYFLAQYEQFQDVISYRFPEKEGSIKKAVQDLLLKASEYQTANGGMRYYPGGEDFASPYLSIFTGYAYMTLKKFGYKTDVVAERKLKSYLKGLLNDDKNWEEDYYTRVKADNRAFILTVLEGLGEKNLMAPAAKLYSHKAELDLFGLSFLMGYMGKSKGVEKEAAALKSDLNSLKEVDGDTIHFKEPKNASTDEYKYWSYTANRDQCVVLQNLIPLTKNKEEASGIVKHVLKQMTNGHWYNTQENIYCFEALRRYADKYEKTKMEGVLTIKLDNLKLNLTEKKKDNMHTMLIDEKNINTKSKKLQIEKKEKGDIYYTNILRFQTPLVSREKINQGIALTKTIFKRNKNGDTFTWEELTGSEIKLKRGDVLKIKLETVSAKDRFQVMLNDSLAGCFEPMNTQLSTTSLATGIDSKEKEEHYPWETAYYRGDFEYMDLRLQAAQFYSRKLTSGTHKVEYMVQTIATGEFTMPEATVEEMYYPDIRGTEKVRKFVVTE
ncbi:MAG: alpha-2-macroglobulin family protein [Bacteriovoracaceae bacterium]